MAVVKAGVNVYEVGKGIPAMTKNDIKEHIYEADFQKDETYKPYFMGRTIDRYQLNWDHKYLKYGPNLAAMRDPKIFQGERILIRQIPTMSEQAILATFTDKILLVIEHRLYSQILIKLTYITC